MQFTLVKKNQLIPHLQFWILTEKTELVENKKVNRFNLIPDKCFQRQPKIDLIIHSFVSSRLPCHDDAGHESRLTPYLVRPKSFQSLEWIFNNIGDRSGKGEDWEEILFHWRDFASSVISTSEEKKYHRTQISLYVFVKHHKTSRMVGRAWRSHAPT